MYLTEEKIEGDFHIPILEDQQVHIEGGVDATQVDRVYFLPYIDLHYAHLIAYLVKYLVKLQTF